MYPVRLPLRGVHSACVTHPLAVAISQLGVASPSPLTTKTFSSVQFRRSVAGRSGACPVGACSGATVDGRMPRGRVLGCHGGTAARVRHQGPAVRKRGCVGGTSGASHHFGRAALRVLAAARRGPRTRAVVRHERGGSGARRAGARARAHGRHDPLRLRHAAPVRARRRFCISFLGRKRPAGAQNSIQNRAPRAEPPGAGPSSGARSTSPRTACSRASSTPAGA